MKYELKNYDNLFGLKGLSDELLKNHFSLYEGYVNNTNKLTEKLNELTKNGMSTTPEFSELKRRFGWEWNGMRLHEYYFENLSKDETALDKNSDLFQKITENFGNYENFEQDFRRTAEIRGIGWVILYYDSINNALFNLWINEHHIGHPAGATPILIMDVFEHAYMLDYGTKKADYIEVFFKAIKWEVAAHRMENSL